MNRNLLCVSKGDEDDICHLISLPMDILIVIFSLLDASSLYFFSKTCYRFRIIIVKDSRKPLNISYLFRKKKLVYESVKSGHLNYFITFYNEWKFKLGKSSLSKLCNIAAFKGYFEVLEYLLTSFHNIILNDHHYVRLCSLAALGGQLSILKWLKEELQVPWDEYTPLYAIKAGHFELLKWVLEDAEGKCDQLTCAVAAESGNFEILKYLRQELACPWDQRTCSAAAKGGHLKILKWVRKVNRCEWTSTVFNFAALNGDIPMLNWLKKHNCPFNGEEASLLATENGKLESLKWFKENGYPLNHDACSFAVTGNHFEILKWLIDIMGCHHDTHVMLMAIKCDRLDMMIFLYERRTYELDSSMVTEAAFVGNPINLKWLIDNGCPFQDVILDILRIASRSGKNEILIYMETEHGIQLNEREILWSIEGGQLRLLKWFIHDKGLPLSKRLTKRAARYGYLNIFKWLIRHKCPWSQKQCLYDAKRYYRYDVTQWIEKQDVEEEKAY